jgi:hypothetical protein
MGERKVPVDELSVESGVARETPGLARFAPLDWIVLAYTLWVMLLLAFVSGSVPHAGRILAFHAAVAAAIALLPARGAPWEQSRPQEQRWRRNLRGGLRFFRYSYPLLLVLFFFEEVQYTVNAVRPEEPHWFERSLYAADRFLFGELPSVLLNPFVGPLQDEILHGFYFSYYFILIGGIVIAWLGNDEKHPGPAFQTTLTAAITAFFLCFVWYPFLPARGPWENPELMATMTPFRGFVFTPLIEAIIERGAVSGGCFPSSHVGGSFGIVLGLLPFQRKPALILLVFALGMSAACIYTRYHHGVDVPVGMLAGLTGAAVAHRLRRQK